MHQDCVLYYVKLYNNSTLGLKKKVINVNTLKNVIFLNLLR